MRYLITITLLWSCCVFTARAQSAFGIKGTVTDTTTHAALEDATITVITAKDSLLQQFTYSDKGAFELTNLTPGQYILLVTNDGYADYSVPFTLNAEHPVVTFKNIAMIERSKLLNEVIILGKAAAVKIKGDTTVFNASAFETQKNAKADDLLRQLPGMSIDANGKITFQGEAVKRILVDGDEFFGDDPVLVSRTVRADMVAQVKVYDDKSENAKLTGVNDGVRVKTINLQLRDDKKKGVFGKLEGDVGNRGYYTGQAMFNKFTPKEKLSVYGNLSNTGKVGLSSADNGRFGDGVNMYSYTSSGNVIGGGSYGGIGIPKAQDGGVHYDTKWNKDKQSINANYKIGALEINNEGSTLSRNNLPGGDYNTSDTKRKSYNYDFTQTADVNFTTVLDSTSNLTTIVRAYDSNGDDESTSNTQTLRGNGNLRNVNQNSLDRSDERRTGSLSLSYVKRLKKKGRSISLSGNGYYAETKAEEYLKSNLSLYDAQGDFTGAAPIDQYKPMKGNSNNLGAGLTYTEPLSAALNMTAGYRLEQNTVNSRQLSYNRSSANVYDDLDNDFSSDFGTLTSSNNYSLGFNYRNNATSFYINSSVAGVRFKQTDNFVDTALTRNFTNFSVNGNLRHKISKTSSVTVYYNGFTSQPQISQIQPIRQNTDPLNITLGNPGLRPQFYSSANLNYSIYYDSSISGFNFSGSYTNTANAIVRTTNRDSAGVNTYQYINLQGRQPSGWRLSASRYGKITKFEISFSPSFSINGSTNYNYINSQLNKMQTVSYNPGIRFDKSTKNYKYLIDVGFVYRANKSSLQTINNNTRGLNANIDLFTKLPLNFYIGTESSYEFTARNQIFTDDFHRVLVKAYFGKNFLADESLKVSISGNDLFNQNTGYSRTGTLDNFTETRNNTIMRYFMLSVTWDFSKFSKAPQTQKQ